jgi:hypothetical protein
MKRCYLAGPMRSRPAFNYPAFMAGAAALRAAGWSVFNPAEMDIEQDGVGAEFLQLTIEDQKSHAGAPANARRYAARDCSVLIGKLRAENGDAIVVLPDWAESVGARAEVAVSTWVGLPVLTLAEACTLQKQAA